MSQPLERESIWIWILVQSSLTQTCILESSLKWAAISELLHCEGRLGRDLAKMWLIVESIPVWPRHLGVSEAKTNILLGVIGSHSWLRQHICDTIYDWQLLFFCMFMSFLQLSACWTSGLIQFSFTHRGLSAEQSVWVTQVGVLLPTFSRNGRWEAIYGEQSQGVWNITNALLDIDTSVQGKEDSIDCWIACCCCSGIPRYRWIFYTLCQLAMKCTWMTLKVVCNFTGLRIVFIRGKFQRKLYINAGCTVSYEVTRLNVATLYDGEKSERCSIMGVTSTPHNESHRTRCITPTQSPKTSRAPPKTGSGVTISTLYKRQRERERVGIRRKEIGLHLTWKTNK